MRRMQRLIATLIVTTSAIAVCADEGLLSCPCDEYGTTVKWYSPEDAQRIAKSKNRPLVLLHLSGNFRKSSFT